jgi:zinc transport system substrate-binding protein
MKLIILFSLFPAFFLFNCVQKQNSSVAKTAVFVSIVPQKYFVDRISGGLIQCHVMVPPGTNAHLYEPHPAQMALLSNAKAYFSIGLEFEGPWLPKFASMAKNMKIFHTDSLVPKQPSECKDEHTAQSDLKQTPHEGLDPHIWLSPTLVKIQAATIASALEEIDPVHRETYRKNNELFLRDIDSLQKAIHVVLPCDSIKPNTPQKAFLVFHPTWGYFAKNFCLRQISIEANGKEPGPRAMKAILDTARLYGIKTIFVQPEYSRKTAEVIARELGATVYEADALAYDWASNLLTVAQRMASR